MTFNSFVTLIEKNLKVFFRSKISAVVIILMPVLIILLAGYGFGSNHLSGVGVGVYSENYSNVTGSILNNFEENGFSINKYSSLDRCINSVKTSKNQICVSFPENLSYSGSSEKVVFYVDYSRTNIAYTLINIVGGGVSTESSSLGENMVQGILDNLVSVRESLIEKKQSLESASNNLVKINEISNNITNPASSLNKIIIDLENSENASEINTEISSLKNISLSISSDFQNLGDISSKSNYLKNSIDSMISDLDLMINSLKSTSSVNAGNLVSPIEVSMESIIPDNTKREYLIPVIIALISLFGAVLIASAFVLKNKKTKAYFRNFVTPTRDFAFVVSTYLTCLIILIMQFVLVFVGLYFLFGMNFFALPLEMIVTLILGWSAFIFIGMFLGYIFKSEETIIFSSVLVSSVLMFFSNLILPLENISERLFGIAQYNPFVVLENSLKKIYLFGLSWDNLWIELCVLAGFIVVFGGLTWLIRNVTKRRL